MIIAFLDVNLWRSIVRALFIKKCLHDYFSFSSTRSSVEAPSRASLTINITAIVVLNSKHSQHYHVPNFFFFCLFWSCKRLPLKPNRFDFHLSSLGGVVMPFPVIPVHTSTSWRVFSVMIQTVQVGEMTALVPPASFIGHSTVCGPRAVIILIFGAEGMTTMTRKRITSSSCRTVTRPLDCSAKYICQCYSRYFIFGISIINRGISKSW